MHCLFGRTPGNYQRLEGAPVVLGWRAGLVDALKIDNT